MYRWIEHTGEQELEIEAATQEDVFRDAMEAFRELVDEGSGEPRSMDVDLPKGDREALLVDWLSELIFLAETVGFVPRSVSSMELADGRLTARLDGVVASPAHLVKAVTWHGLAFEPGDSGWRARVVLDV